ncbi:acylphosphatase [Patescibacteria group bacterium]
MEQTQALLKIVGRVQGVFFRDYAVTKASELGLTGYVRNAPDGTVEVLAQGSKEKIQELINWCYEGSPSAKVEDVVVDWQKVEESLEGFHVVY